MSGLCGLYSVVGGWGGVFRCFKSVLVVLASFTHGGVVEVALTKG